jgi:hypothetical protein
MTEETNEETVQKILAQAEVFGQLLGFSTFKEFLEINFEIIKNVDPDTENVSWAVVERPATYVEEKLREKALELQAADTGPKIGLAPASALDHLKKS